MADTSLSEKKIGILIWHVSNYWQIKLRKILKKHNISLNEYHILDSLNHLQNKSDPVTQIKISTFSGIDVSVVSVCLKLLSEKKLITRIFGKDNRKKEISLMPEGAKLFNDVFPLINQQENDIFDKLKNEKLNFCNSLKLILGKKIRIKAK